jgi:putative endonuclease
MTGTCYEAQAAAYLESCGYHVMQRNYRCRAGEIDLIARQAGYLVFVEVKYRSDASCGFGMEAVDYHKQRRIIRAARWYLAAHGYADTQPCRFDVVSFLGKEITLITDAFELSD